jgi:hypothetical protein
MLSVRALLAINNISLKHRFFLNHLQADLRSLFIKTTRCFKKLPMMHKVQQWQQKEEILLNKKRLRKAGPGGTARESVGQCSSA